MTDTPAVPQEALRAAIRTVAELIHKEARSATLLCATLDVDWIEEQVRTVVVAALSARVTAEPVAQWRPIETAPKDGTRVLIFAGDVYAAHWDERFEPIYDPDRESDPAYMGHYRGAWTDNAVVSFGYEECAEYDPTHWKPLPAPPALSTSDTGEAET